MTPRAPFGSQRGELASVDVALALRRAAQLREREEQVRAERTARRREWFARLRARFGPIKEAK